MEGSQLSVPSLMYLVVFAKIHKLIGEQTAFAYLLTD